MSITTLGLKSHCILTVKTLKPKGQLGQVTLTDLAVFNEMLYLLIIQLVLTRLS